MELKTKKESKQEERLKMPDSYTCDILRKRFYMYKEKYNETANIIKSTGLPIRHENPPEDITENIVKYILINYENDKTCKWAKAIGIKGDLYSAKYNTDYPPEVKAFTSNGPSQFGPKKKFGVLYFLDMRKWLDDTIILWRVNVTNESPNWKNVKMNKTQTNEDQCEQGRRPHISWDKLSPQITEYSVKVYEGSFEGIFTQSIEE